ncbi:MAG: hypothetical protein RIR69_1387 [Actinomycetota bacterium]
MKFAFSDSNWGIGPQQGERGGGIHLIRMSDDDIGEIVAASIFCAQKSSALVDIECIHRALWIEHCHDERDRSAATSKVAQILMCVVHHGGVLLHPLQQNGRSFVETVRTEHPGI